MKLQAFTDCVFPSVLVGWIPVIGGLQSSRLHLFSMSNTRRTNQLCFDRKCSLLQVHVQEASSSSTGKFKFKFNRQVQVHVHCHALGVALVCPQSQGLQLAPALTSRVFCQICLTLCSANFRAQVEAS